MPRSSRKDSYSEFFHIMIHGINKEYIFNELIEINTYLKYLKEKTNDKNLQIVAYCMMNNHAHFLIHSKDIKEISKLMSQVNTRYAIFYNKRHGRSGFVFKNRYKAEQILTYSHLISCINYIHNNPIKAKICNTKEEYKYSSYYDYKNNKKILGIVDITDIVKNYNIPLESILRGEYELYKFLDDIEVEDKEKLKENIVDKFLKENHLKSINEVKLNKKYLKDLSVILYIEYNFKQTEIAEIIGVNRLKIHRIIHEL